MTVSRDEVATSAVHKFLGAYESATNKASATARMYYLGNCVAEPLGPGSKEKKCALVALGRVVGLDLEHVARKSECGRLIAMEVGANWDDECVSGGDTITLVGLNRLIDGAAARYLASGARPQRAFVRDLMSVNPAPKQSDLEEEVMSDDVTELEHGISEQIVQLMQDGPVPEGVEADQSVEFDGDGTDGRWRTPLLAVQGWLHLAYEIDPTSLGTYDATLARLLGIDDLAAAGEVDYLSAIQSRLEQANELRTVFVEELEDESEGSATLATASGHWEESWDDAEESAEAEGGGPITARAETWVISTFRGEALEAHLNLSPSYQRADVWRTPDAQLLIESVLRGIPLPSVILLEENEVDGDHYEIIDGKQRLTAILRFIGAHPQALANVRKFAGKWGMDGDDLVATFQRDYLAFRKIWSQHESESLTSTAEGKYYFPFKTRGGDRSTLVGGLEDIRGRYYTQVKDIAIPVSDGVRKVQHIFENQNSKYLIPVIIYSQVTSRQIHEVFSLYNRQGKRLNAEEIRNAAFHELALMRALLVTSGDAEDPAAVAPFLMPDWDDLSTTAEALSDPTGAYAMPAAGYKRTKALSWVAAALLMEDDGVVTRSTANHVNALLRRVQESKHDPLRTEETVARLMRLLDGAVDVHQLVPGSGWGPNFKNTQGKGRWQELQLVATLVAFGAAYAVRGEALEDQVYGAVGQIRQASARWARPKKTQSKQQWQFIGGVVREFLALLGVSADEADSAVRSQFGSSGIATLVRIEEPDWKEWGAQ